MASKITPRRTCLPPEKKDAGPASKPKEASPPPRTRSGAEPKKDAGPTSKPKEASPSSRTRSGAEPKKAAVVPQRRATDTFVRDQRRAPVDLNGERPTAGVWKGPERRSGAVVARPDGQGVMPGPTNKGPDSLGRRPAIDPKDIGLHHMGPGPTVGGKKPVVDPKDLGLHHMGPDGTIGAGKKPVVDPKDLGLHHMGPDGTIGAGKKPVVDPKELGLHHMGPDGTIGAGKKPVVDPKDIGLHHMGPGPQTVGGEKPGPAPGIKVPLLNGRVGNPLVIKNALEKGNVHGALNEALNSPGDSIKLSVGANGKVGAGGNVGIEAQAEFTVTKKPPPGSGYEVRVDGGVGVNVGAEVAAKNGVTGKLGVGVGNVYAFDSLKDAEKGMLAIAAVTAERTTGTIGALAGAADSALGIVGVGPQAYLNQHLVAIELKGSAALELALTAGAPVDGLNAAKFGAGVSAEVAVRLDLPKDGPPPVPAKLSLDQTLTAKVNGGVGAGVQGEGEVTLTANLHDEYTLKGFDKDTLGKVLTGNNPGLTLERTANSATLSMESVVKGSVGAVVTAGAGVGGKGSITIDNRDAIGFAALKSFLAGDTAPLKEQLRNTPVTVEMEVYTTAYLKAGGDVSIGGNGGGLTGEVEWKDQVGSSETHTTIGEAVDGGQFTVNQFLRTIQNVDPRSLVH